MKQPGSNRGTDRMEPPGTVGGDAVRLDQGFRNVLDALPAAVYTTDADGQVTYYNVAAEVLAGRRPQVGTDRWSLSWKLYRPDGSPLPPADCPMAISLREGRAIRGEEVIVERPDGTRLNCMPYPTPLRDVDGRIIGGINLLVDVSDRKLAEDGLRESELRFTQFMQHLPGLAWIKDRDGRYVYANGAAQDAFGARLQDLIGRTDRELFASDTAAEFAAHDLQVLANDHAIQTIETLAHGDGTVHHSIVSKFPLPDRTGQTTMVGGVAIDVTELKQAEEALSEADRRKDQFMAMLAHELRGPLAPICNSIEVFRRIGEPAASPVLQGVMGTIERQVNQLVRLVDDLLDVSRITRGRIELRCETVDLGAIAQHAVEAARPLCQALQQTLTMSLPSATVRVNADPARLIQVLGNLLSNASKYTGRGGQIALSVDPEPELGSTPASVAIRIRDNGIGIEAAQMSRIFELFMQVDTSLERVSSGLGIGLTLVKTLVDMHGGTVEVASAGIGQGSEFTVRLPLLPVATQPAPSTAEPILPKMKLERRILVVDDNRDSADSLAALLQMDGHAVATAYDGMEAIEAASGFRPDVILLDIGMPKLNGLETARRIRSQQATGRPFIVALTGWGQQSDRQASKEAGFDAHLVKPVDDQALAKLLSDLPALPA